MIDTKSDVAEPAAKLAPASAPGRAQRRTAVVVVDMQPITPAIGGGRLRLLGLYHGMGEGIEVTYVGSYDWPGERARDQRLSPGLREICVPLSDAHHAAAAELSKKLNGAIVIDSAFSTQVALSPDWLDVARAQVRAADVVVFSHPWAYPPLRDQLSERQLVVYDSQNVESLLKADLLGLAGDAAQLVQQVTLDEFELCTRADLILACSRTDIDAFGRLFAVAQGKMRLVPNGAFVERARVSAPSVRAEVRKSLNITQPAAVAVFVGSAYGPNLQAARFVAEQLCAQLPHVFFVIVGGACDALAGRPIAANLRLAGVVDDAHRDDLLYAADLAINPMSSGSGTNIKMFDYLAAGLPVVSTETGARGICDALSAPPAIEVAALPQFAAAVESKLAALREHNELAAQARDFVRQNFSWERISRELGLLLQHEFAAHGQTLQSHRSRPKVWILGTWNITCGIAQHACYLAEALQRAGAEVLILGNHMRGHLPTGFAEEMHYPVARLWTWDNRTWRDSSVDIGALDRALLHESPDCVVIQHHTGFMPLSSYEEIISRLHAYDAQVLVEFHDARNVPVESLERFATAADTLLVHADQELERVPALFRHCARQLPLPVSAGVAAATAQRESSGRVIGGFGFLRPYKGVLTAIRVVAALRDKYPDIRYRGWHAMYDSGESAQHLAECRAEAQRLGVADRIEIDTTFHSLERIIADLRKCDAVLLPYAVSSEEGASAAVNCALAAGRATIVSEARIFRPVAQAVRVVAGGRVEDYRDAIHELLSKPALRADLEHAAGAWSEQYSYANAAQRILQLGCAA